MFLFYYIPQIATKTWDNHTIWTIWAIKPVTRIDGKSNVWFMSYMLYNCIIESGVMLCASSMEVYYVHSRLPPHRGEARCHRFDESTVLYVSSNGETTIPVLLATTPKDSPSMHHRKWNHILFIMNYVFHYDDIALTYICIEPIKSII